MKDKIIIFMFVLYIGVFSILHIVFKDQEISISERRGLTSFPEFRLSNEYITKIDKYLLDHFPFRDSFRSIKASFNYGILNKLDNNDIYIKDNYIYKSNYPTNYSSITNFMNKINNISKDFKNNNIYTMIIPDKNYYLNDSNFLHIDYNYIYDEIDKLGFNNIDIRGILNINDYYETDTHWRQEHLDKVVKKILFSMDNQYYKMDFKENIYDKFYGVYYGEAAVFRKPERLIYLTSDIFEYVEVKYLENEDLNGIYNLEKLAGLDSYEVYLDGASAFIEINNFNSSSDRELIIFRDSFGSSIVPLLVPYYKKIILIDNRYINSSNYLELINMSEQDILFMYSTLVVNSSSSLKG